MTLSAGRPLRQRERGWEALILQVQYERVSGRDRGQGREGEPHHFCLDFSGPIIFPQTSLQFKVSIGHPSLDVMCRFR